MHECGVYKVKSTQKRKHIYYKIKQQLTYDEVKC